MVRKPFTLMSVGQVIITFLIWPCNVSSAVLTISIEHEFAVMHVVRSDDSAFSLVRAAKTVGLDPETTTMNGLSIRMILFIVVLSALHISGITPVKPSAIQVPQEAPWRPTLQTRASLSPHQVIAPLHAN
jgi:hypothetical protein